MAMKTSLALTADTTCNVLLAAGWRVASAESCTGGLLAHCLTERSGASHWFEGSVVAYSNAAKTALLQVPAEIIERAGAVSAAVASAMAEGALAALPGAHLAVAITGVAGPTGGSAETPVGCVWFGFAQRDSQGGVKTYTRSQQFGGPRRVVREQAVVFALREITQLAQQASIQTLA